ncbi:MAG: type II toxin-antitoxin system Phd/YefM family antitoxin [Betaproteobacteria bacterium]
MNSITVTEARKTLYTLINETADRHEPILISGKKANAVLISEEDWNAVNETLHLLSTQGMRESIIEGLQTPLEDCDEYIEW